MFYNSVLTLHLLSAILFIGTVYFRTFAMLPYTKKEEFMKRAYELSGKKGRFLAYFFVTALALSGLYLGYIKATTHSTTPLLLVKMVLGVVVVCIFYVAPKIVKRANRIKNFGFYFHVGLFSCMILIVILAKFQYLL